MHRRPSSADDARALVNALLLDRPGRTTYAIRLVGVGSLGAAGTLVGTSRSMEADLTNERIHLGATLYGQVLVGYCGQPRGQAPAARPTASTTVATAASRSRPTR